MDHCRRCGRRTIPDVKKVSLYHLKRWSCDTFFMHGSRVLRGYIMLCTQRNIQISDQSDFPHDGNETQKSWKPLLNTIFVLRGSLECSVRRSDEQMFCIFCEKSRKSLNTLHYQSKSIPDTQRLPWAALSLPDL